MKILVIGSFGFIGSHCFDYFEKKGNTVFGCDIYPSKTKNYIQIEQEAINYLNVFGAESFDVCINASGSRGVGFSLENPQMDHDLNVRNVGLMLDSLKSVNPKCKFINLSSAAIYGNQGNLRLKESLTPSPISPYGKHKLESELLLKEKHTKEGLRTCSLRIFSVYGPGLKKQIFWDIYQKTKTADNHKVSLFGTGEELRDFIFISDLMHAIEIIISSSGFTGEAINVATGKELSIKQAASLFSKYSGNSYTLNFIGTHKSGDPDNLIADVTKLTSLGFNPKTSFEEGIKLYALWLKENI